MRRRRTRVIRSDGGHAFSAAVAKLPVRSCLIDGEAIVCDANEVAVFDLLRRRWHDEDVILSALDLLELDDKDMRRAPIRGTEGDAREATASAA